jgi:hypothetical protein
MVKGYETCIFIVSGIEIPVTLPASWKATETKLAWGLRAVQIKSRLREACRRYLGPGCLHHDKDGYHWAKMVDSRAEPQLAT